MNNLVNLLVAEAETTVKGLTLGNQNHLIARYCLCDRFMLSLNPILNISVVKVFQM